MNPKNKKAIQKPKPEPEPQESQPQESQPQESQPQESQPQESQLQEQESDKQEASIDEKDDKRKVIVILEKACLETGKINQKIELLNCDEHRKYITTKLKKDYSTYRPDITHQCLLTLLDSPLNKAGLLQIYIHTEKNVLIKINPSTKIPRTFKRFSALMAQLLTKLKIRAQQNSETLLKVIKNPVTSHLPTNCLKIGTSSKARLVKMNEFVEKLPKNGPIAFVVGAVAVGNPAIEIDYIEDSICISKYGLSASYCLGRILNAFESLWEIN